MVAKNEFLDCRGSVDMEKLQEGLQRVDKREAEVRERLERYLAKENLTLSSIRTIENARKELRQLREKRERIKEGFRVPRKRG